MTSSHLPYATTYFAPVSAGPSTVISAPAAPPQLSNPSTRPSSTKSSRSRRRDAAGPSHRSHETSPPLPTSPSSFNKTRDEIPPPLEGATFQTRSSFGSTSLNMYDSSASLSASEDDSDSGAARRERRSRRNGERQRSSVATTPSSSTSSAPRASRRPKEQPHPDRRKSSVGSLTKAPAPSKREAAPVASGDRGLGVQIEGLGWDMGAAQRAQMLNGAYSGAQAGTYVSDLGSGISSQTSSPEIVSTSQAPTPTAPALAHLHPPVSAPAPQTLPRTRPPRSRPLSTRPRSEAESKKTPRFLAEQVADHEHDSLAGPTVELHPDHIDFSAVISASSSKSPSRRSSIGSTLRTPSLVHSPSSNGHSKHDTPPLPSSSASLQRDRDLQRTKSISSVGSSRSQAISHFLSAGQPTPKAVPATLQQAYFPPPPPPKSARRPKPLSSPPVSEEAWGTSSTAPIFPAASPRLHQSTSPFASSGPFPGPPTSAAARQRSPPATASPVFPTTTRPSPRMPSSQSMPQLSSTASPSVSPTASNRRGSQIFPSAARPGRRTSTLLASPALLDSSPRSPTESAPWELEGEDELDWMVSAQRKLDPTKKVASPKLEVREVSASRRVEQTRSVLEQAAYEREEGAGSGDDDDEVIDIKDLMLEEELEKHGLPAYNQRTPTKLSTALRAVAPAERSPRRAPHQQHRPHLSLSSTGTSDYASAEEDVADDLALAQIIPPHLREQPIFPSGPRSTSAPVDPVEFAFLQQQADQTGLWVLEGISNAAVGENSRRMSAIGEEAESDGKDSANEDERGGASGRLNRKRLSLMGSEGAGGRSGEATPTSGTPTRTVAQHQATPPQPSAVFPPPPQTPQRLAPSSGPQSPSIARSPRSPALPANPHSPSRPSPQRNPSTHSRHSLYNFSNSSTLSTQTHISGASSINSASRKRRLSQKLGSLFGTSNASERGAVVEKGISSEHMRAWAALEEQQQQETLLETEAVKENLHNGAVSSSPSSHKKEEVVLFESLLEKFGREEKERLASLRAAKWATAHQATDEQAAV